MLKDVSIELESKQKIDQSQIGLFIHLIVLDGYDKSLDDLSSLSRNISSEFNLVCEESDLENYFSINNLIPKDSFESESNKVKYQLTN